MDMQTLSTLVGSLGFPIVVSGYLLVKVVPAIDGLKDAVTKLTVRLDGGSNDIKQ